MSRWSIYIDVEGFSEIYTLRQGRAIQALAELMQSLFLISVKEVSDSTRATVHPSIWKWI